MKQVPGYEHADKGLVLKLHKALYGLKQSSQQWFLYISISLQKFVFEQSVSDSCVFTKHTLGSDVTVLIFVDYILFIHNTVVWKCGAQCLQNQISQSGYPLPGCNCNTRSWRMLPVDSKGQDCQTVKWIWYGRCQGGIHLMVTNWLILPGINL